MSYTRTVHTQVTVYYHGTVSYPASQNGGTIGYSGSETEDVAINITVDTDPFEQSVATCNNRVNLLTGAVAGTEAAQVLSINKNSSRVAKTIINGFFKTIGSEISQQINELIQTVQSSEVTLLELMKRCREKKDQMTVDYGRICSRYQKTFETLNKELENDIYQLDKPIFNFSHSTNHYTRLGEDGDMVSTVAITGAEENELQAKLNTAKMKQQTLLAIQRANEFLQLQKHANATIEHNMHEEATDQVYYAPLLFMEVAHPNGSRSQTLHTPKKLKSDIPPSTAAAISQRPTMYVTAEDRERISRYLYQEIGKQFSKPDAHQTRVRDMMLQLFQNNILQTIR